MSLILRGDEGCVTEDRSVQGVLSLTLEADWYTEGYTENTSTDNGNAGDFADDIFDALDELDNPEDLQVDKVTIAGARGRVTNNQGHSAARTATVMITTQNKAQRTLLTMAVPNNNTGQEVSASDNAPDKYLDLEADAVTALNDDFQAFLNRYLANDRDGARNILNGISWSASWATDPGDPPTVDDQDDFHWVTEIIVSVPINYDVTVPAF